VAAADREAQSEGGRNEQNKKVAGDRGTADLLALAGCTTPTLTLTIHENACTFDGLASVHFGEIRIRLIIEEQIPTESGYALATLEEGKSIDDFRDWSSAEQLEWLYLLDGVHEYAAGSHTYGYDLANLSTTYNGEPLYIGCFRKDPETGQIQKLDAFGPIVVNK
jgi:hypothetical protein